MADERKVRGSAATGTRRLLFAFGTGFVGIAWLAVVLVPVVTGRVEAGATVVSVETLERDGFPEALHLEVTGGNLVLSRARAWCMGHGGKRSLINLTVPVVSDGQLAEWERGGDGPLDLSRLRLVAVFSGDDVAERWPEVSRRALAEEPLDLPPVKMTLTGDTVVARGQLSLPDFPGTRTAGLDWSAARRLSPGVHHDSPGRVLGHALVALALLAVSFLTFRHHVRNPTRPPPGGLDLTPLLDGSLDL